MWGAGAVPGSGQRLDDAGTCWAWIVERAESHPFHHSHTPVVGAEDEKCTGFWHGHCFFLKVQLRQWSWSGAHRHLGLLLILFSCKKKSTFLNNVATPIYSYHCAAHFQYLPTTGIKTSFVSLKTGYQPRQTPSSPTVGTAGVHLRLRKTFLAAHDGVTNSCWFSQDCPGF